MTKKEEILVEEGSRQAPEKYYIKITFLCLAIFGLML